MATGIAYSDANGKPSPSTMACGGQELEPFPMSIKQGIATAIEAKVKAIYDKYASWRIGLTHDWADRKKQWENAGESVTAWGCWQADSLSDAQGIESHFINKGMKGGTGGNLDSRKTVYVYIF